MLLATRRRSSCLEPAILEMEERWKDVPQHGLSKARMQPHVSAQEACHWRRKTPKRRQWALLCMGSTLAHLQLESRAPATAWGSCQLGETTVQRRRQACPTCIEANKPEFPKIECLYSVVVSSRFAYISIRFMFRKGPRFEPWYRQAVWINFLRSRKGFQGLSFCAGVRYPGWMHCCWVRRASAAARLPYVPSSIHASLSLFDALRMRRERRLAAVGTRHLSRRCGASATLIMKERSIASKVYHPFHPEPSMLQGRCAETAAGH